MSALADATVNDAKTRPISSYIVFGEIVHPITPGPLNKASVFQHCKANSYSQTTRLINTKAAQKPKGSEKPSAPKVPDTLMPVNTKPASISRDTWIAVSNWLATSQSFEKPQKPVEEPPPSPPSPKDPAPWKRLHQEYWSQISKSLDLRLEARSGQPKAPVHSGSGPEYAHRGTIDGGCDDSCELAGAEMRTLRDGTHAVSNPVAIGLPPEEGREDDRPLEILYTSQLQVKPERHSQTRESLGAIKMNEADEATPKQAEMAGSEKAHEASIMQAKDEQLTARSSNEEVKEEAEKTVTMNEITHDATAKQASATEPQKSHEASAAQASDEQLTAQNLNEEIKAKAKKLAANAIATDGRKRYVKGRAWDIHEKLLLYKPFDVDAVRREFSEEEVGDVKRIVRELGFLVWGRGK